MSPLPILLLILCAVSWMVGETKGALVIGSMVFLSITLAFIQEHRSTRAAEKLKELVSIKITVMRHGELIDIPMREVVPGDLVNLSAGDIIPGDLRLIETKDLFVDQSSLTGEAIPAEKQAHATQHAGTGYDTPNICFMGSHVTSGLGKGLVFATAIDTHFGHLAKDITSRRKKTGFDLGVEKFIWLMIQFMLVLVPLVFLINGLIKGDWLEALLFAMAVAVGLTPEMLPLLVMINLAKGAISMAKKKVGPLIRGLRRLMSA
jgi:Mg2+-importing ATPase